MALRGHLRVEAIVMMMQDSVMVFLRSRTLVKNVASDSPGRSFSDVTLESILSVLPPRCGQCT